MMESIKKDPFCQALEEMRVRNGGPSCAEPSNEPRDNVTISRLGPFRDYVASKGLNECEFKKLSKKDRGNLLLKWKWRTHDVNAATELQMTRNFLINSLNESDFNDEYWLLTIKHEAHCFETARKVGADANIHVSPEVIKALQDVEYQKKKVAVDWND